MSNPRVDTKFFRLTKFLELKHSPVTLDVLSGMVVQCINAHEEMHEMFDYVHLKNFTVGVDPNDIRTIRQCGINKTETTHVRYTAHSKHRLLRRIWMQIWHDATTDPTLNEQYFAQFFMTYLTAEQTEHVLLIDMNHYPMFQAILKQHGPPGKHSKLTTTTLSSYLGQKQSPDNIHALACDLLELLNYLDANEIQYNSLTIKDLSVVYNDHAVTTEIRFPRLNRRSFINTPDGRSENRMSVWTSIFQFPGFKLREYCPSNMKNFQTALMNNILPIQEEQIIAQMHRVAKPKQKS